MFVFRQLSVCAVANAISSPSGRSCKFQCRHELLDFVKTMWCAKESDHAEILVPLQCPTPKIDVFGFSPTRDREVDFSSNGVKRPSQYFVSCMNHLN
jgi:hypothetical protein